MTIKEHLEHLKHKFEHLLEEGNALYPGLVASAAIIPTTAVMPIPTTMPTTTTTTTTTNNSTTTSTTTTKKMNTRISDYIPSINTNDQILDYSKCGPNKDLLSLSNNHSIPIIPIPLSSTIEDIQQLLNTANQYPIVDNIGFRIIFQFEAGEYYFNDPNGLLIEHSGIILRGAVNNENLPQTRLHFLNEGSQTLFTITGRGYKQRFKKHGIQVIKDIPLNNRTLHIHKTNEFRVGEEVRLVKECNQQMIEKLEMDHIPERPNTNGSTKQWKPFHLLFNRRIINIREINDGEMELELDVPLSLPIELKYGSLEIFPLPDKNKEEYPEQVELENILIMNLICLVDPICTLNNTLNYDIWSQNQYSDLYKKKLVYVDWTRDCMVYHCHSFGFAQFSHFDRQSQYCSVVGCSYQLPVGKLSGGERYGFFISGSLHLISKCFSQGARHGYITDSRVTGPNVFHQSVAVDGHGSSETHHRFATGILFDSLTTSGHIPFHPLQTQTQTHNHTHNEYMQLIFKFEGKDGGGVAVENRLWMGTGQGWAGVYCLCYNIDGSVCCQMPPIGWNLCIGKQGRVRYGKFAFPTKRGGEREGYFLVGEEWGMPESLFEYQRGGG